MNSVLRRPNTLRLLRERRTERLMFLLPFYLWINKRRSFRFSWLEMHVSAVRSSRRMHLLCSLRPIALSVSRKWTRKYTELAVIICEGLFKFEGNVEEKRQTDRNPDEGLVRVEQSGLSLRECVYASVCVCVSAFHIVAWWCCLGQSAGVNGLNLLAHDSQIVLITK